MGKLTTEPVRPGMMGSLPTSSNQLLQDLEPFVGLSRKKVLLTGLIQQTCEGGAYVLLQPPEGGIMVQGVLQRQDDTEDFFQPKRGCVGRCEWEVGWETLSLFNLSSVFFLGEKIVGADG